ACFVYLYDERSGELVLRATHGTSVEEMTRTPRMRPGEGITGAAAAQRTAVMIPSQANLDPRFKEVPNLPEDESESVLAVPITAPGARRGARARGRADRLARGARRRARRADPLALEAPPDRRARGRPRHAVHRRRARAARGDRAPRGGGAGARPRRDAWRARPGDPP